MPNTGSRPWKIPGVGRDWLRHIVPDHLPELRDDDRDPVSDSIANLLDRPREIGPRSPAGLGGVIQTVGGSRHRSQDGAHQEGNVVPLVHHILFLPSPRFGGR